MKIGTDSQRVIGGMGERRWERGRAERGKTFGSIVVDRDSARRDFRAFLVGDVGEDYIARQAVSDFEGCHLGISSFFSFAMWD